MVLELKPAWKSSLPLKQIASGSNPARITKKFFEKYSQVAEWTNAN